MKNSIDGVFHILSGHMCRGAMVRLFYLSDIKFIKIYFMINIRSSRGLDDASSQFALR